MFVCFLKNETYNIRRSETKVEWRFSLRKFYFSVNPDFKKASTSVVKYRIADGENENISQEYRFYSRICEKKFILLRTGFETLRFTFKKILLFQSKWSPSAKLKADSV